MHTRDQKGQAERVKIDLRNFPGFYRVKGENLDADVRRGANAGQKLELALVS